MHIDTIMATGLSKQQAEVYALLIEHGSLKPRLIASELGLTRSNAYKILDKLVELGLVVKTEKGKTLSYSPANPINLVNMTSQFRAQATAREEAANSVMQSLMTKYYNHADGLHTDIGTGAKAVADLYRRQIALKEELFFVRTAADITTMGFDLMHDIRTAPARYGVKRHGILSVPQTGIVNNAAHERSNLEATWLETGQYTAPVEWSATESSLLIVVYGREPQAILIVDPLIGLAFTQLWKIMSELLKTQPTHRSHAGK